MTPCPKCNSTYTYEMDHLMVCPECAHEWNPNEIETDNDAFIVKDSNGNILKDGDSVIVIKDLPVKGFSKNIKVGTINAILPKAKISKTYLGKKEINSFFEVISKYLKLFFKKFLIIKFLPKKIVSK